MFNTMGGGEIYSKSFFLYPFILLSDLMWMPCMVCALFTPCYEILFFPPTRVKMWLGAVCLESTELRELCGGGCVPGVLSRGVKWRMFAESLLDGLCLKCFWMHFMCFVNQREFSKIKLNLTRYIAYLRYFCFVDINWNCQHFNSHV